MKIRRMLCALCTLVLVSVLVLPVSVFASESGGTTTLTTTVPDTHTVNLIIEGNGTVKVGNQEYKNSQTIHVERLSEQVYQMKPDKDWQLDKVMYGTEDTMKAVAVKDDMFTAPVLNHDGNTLKVVFTEKAGTGTKDPSDKDPSDKDKGNGVQTGDTTNLALWGILLIASAAAVYGLNQKRKIND